MIDIIVIAVVLVIVGLAVKYIVDQKKKGVTCIGCPHATTCGRACEGGCNAGDDKMACDCHAE